MASIVEICNIALEHVGRAAISSIDEESTEAQRCKTHYDQARKKVLSVYHYRFQRRIAALAQLESNDRSDRWLYAYAAPADLLTVRRIVSDAEAATIWGEVEMAVPYEFESGTIYCDVQSAYLDYSSSSVDSQLYPPLVADAIASELASRIAYPLTRDRQMRGDMLQLARAERLMAEAWDANQTPNDTNPQSTFINARA